jgi:RNA polymerase-binding transcription factor DksA
MIIQPSEDTMSGNKENEGDPGNAGQGRELFATTLMESDLTWLTSVSEAVERINKGNYGECLSCGKDIDEKILDAFPWVAFCSRCLR